MLVERRTIREMRANGAGGAGTYSKVPGAGTRQTAKDIVGGSLNNRGVGGAKPPAMGARAGPNVRARANGGGAGVRGSSRGGEDADQIMSYESKGGASAAQRSGSANRRAGASAAAYNAQSLGMGVEALKGGVGAAAKRNSS